MKWKNVSYRAINWRTRKGIAIISAAVLIVASLGGYTYFKPETASNPAQGQGARSNAQRQMPVEIQPVTMSEVSGGLVFSGAITPVYTTNVSSRVSGRVAEMMVKVGERVKVGQDLAKIDTTTLEQQAAQSQSSLALSEAQYARTVNDQANSLAKAENDYIIQQAQFEKTKADQHNAVVAAKQAVAITQAQLNNAIANQQNAIASAKQSVASAQVSLNKVINDTHLALNKAQNTLGFQQDNLQTSQTNNLDKLQLDFEQALHAFESADLAYDNSPTPERKNAVDSAGNKLEAAQLALEQAKQTPISNISSTLKSYLDAQSDLMSAQNSQAVQIAQESLNEKLIALANAQAASTEVNQQQLQRDQLALANAQATMQHALNISKTQLTQSEQSLNAAKATDVVNVSAAQYQQAQTNFKVVQQQLEDSVLKSPVDGIITAINTPVGQNAGGQTGIVAIAAIDPIQALINVSEANIGKMKVGMSMNVNVPTLGKKYEGIITAIRPTLDVVTKAYGVEIKIDDSQQELLPGMFITSSLKSEGRKAIMVPADAVLSQPSGTAVFIVKDGKAKKISVKTGTLTSSLFEIVSGLNEGDELVIKGQELLSDKVAIQIVQPAKEGANQGDKPEKSNGSGANRQAPRAGGQ